MVIDGQSGLSGEESPESKHSADDAVGGPEYNEGWAPANILSGDSLIGTML